MKIISDLKWALVWFSFTVALCLTFYYLPRYIQKRLVAADTMQDCIRLVAEWHPGWVCNQKYLCDGNNKCIADGFELKPKPVTK